MVRVAKARQLTAVQRVPLSIFRNTVTEGKVPDPWRLYRTGNALANVRMGREAIARLFNLVQDQVAGRQDGRSTPNGIGGFYSTKKLCSSSINFGNKDEVLGRFNITEFATRKI